MEHNRKRKYVFYNILKLNITNVLNMKKRLLGMYYKQINYHKLLFTTIVVCQYMYLCLSYVIKLILVLNVWSIGHLFAKRKIV